MCEYFGCSGLEADDVVLYVAWHTAVAGSFELAIDSSCRRCRGQWAVQRPGTALNRCLAGRGGWQAGSWSAAVARCRAVTPRPLIAAAAAVTDVIPAHQSQQHCRPICPARSCLRPTRHASVCSRSSLLGTSCSRLSSCRHILLSYILRIRSRHGGTRCNCLVARSPLLLPVLCCQLALHYTVVNTV